MTIAPRFSEEHSAIHLPTDRKASIIMKAINHLKRLAIPGSVAALALVIAGCASARRDVVEEQQFIQLHHVQNTDDALKLNTGDATAMVCTKCKTVLFANVDKPRTRFFAPLERRHYCPGCKSTITTTGAGFNMKQEAKHTCGACGDDSVFCCATAASNPTEGMQKK